MDVTMIPTGTHPRLMAAATIGRGSDIRTDTHTMEH